VNAKIVSRAAERKAVIPSRRSEILEVYFRCADKPDGCAF
jgi:hypothetical protein